MLLAGGLNERTRPMTLAARLRHHAPVPRDLPVGLVTLLFTDVEGSTKLLHELGAEAYAAELVRHRQIVRSAFTAQGGVEVDTQGDAFFFAFPTAEGAVQAAAAAQTALAEGPVRIRIGLHTGTPTLADEGYVGQDIHLAARIAAAAHGGQVVLSRETRRSIDETLSVMDLGEHRVKDFIEPVWLYQLGGEPFPPLRTISNTNLPRPASSFVGRDREVEEVTRLLRDGARLLTLTGPGGTGKSRLAIEAASELVPAYRNGVFWVALDAVRDAALVADTIGSAIGAHGDLAAHVGEREMLLVLDNFEQVVAAAPELSTLLEACRNLRLLVTSRERLRVRGEVDYAVPPLADSEAVDLFCLRARIDPDETVAELCRRLENLPLALELAAARASVLTPAQILARLAQRLDMLKGGRDAEARQQTLRATIEWSHDLLTPDERALFANLAAFTGGCTLEAAEAVAGADLDTLGSLVDKSLVRRRDARFTMLETIREYAAERLEVSGQADELRRRHAEHFLALVEAAEPEVRRDSMEWLDRLESEHDNLRAALDWLQTSGDSQGILRFMGAAWRFWYLKGHIAEGARRLEDALRSDDRSTPARAKALNGAAVMALNRGDAATTRHRAAEALELHRALGNAWGAAYAGFMLAQAANEEGDIKAAAGLFDQSLAAFRGLGDDHYSWIAAFNLAIAIEDLGDAGRAKALQEDNLLAARRLGDRNGEAHALTQLAMLAFQDERFDDASSTLKHALRIFMELGNVLEIAVNLGRFAAFLARSGNAAAAAQLLAKSEVLTTEIGAGTLSWALERNTRTMATINEHLDEGGVREAQAKGRAMTVNQAVALALGSAESR